MAQLDYAKEQLGLLKLFLSLCLGTLIAIVGWFAVNYETAKFWTTLASLAIFLILTIFSIFIGNKIMKKLDEIKEL